MVGRLLVGLGIGVSAVVVPAYLGEVAPPQARGTIVELYEVTGRTYPTAVPHLATEPCHCLTHFYEEW